MNPPFVKKFDFRGEYGKDITNADAYYLARAITKVIPMKKVLVGWDTRVSSFTLANNFIQGMLEEGIEVQFIPLCPIDYITAAANIFDFDLSVMFTGSHNSWTWTGLLMHLKGGDSLQGTLVEKIVKEYSSLIHKPFKQKSVALSEIHNLTQEVELAYADKIKSLIPLEQIKALRILADVGDGSGSKALDLLEKLFPQVVFTRIHDRKLYDKDSAHIADPSNVENMKDLIQEMSGSRYDCGFAFDSDADRVLSVDENGEYVNGSLLGSVHIESLLELGFSDTTFGYAVDCGMSMQDTVLKLNLLHENKLSCVPIPVGRSLVRGKLRQNLDLGVENVGHFYTKDFFKTDSGAFSMIIILYWISKHGKLSQIFKLHPDGLRGQTSFPTLNATQIEKISASINLELSSYKAIKTEIDGIRYDFYTGEQAVAWYTIRQSGYEKITKCYFGALNQNIFEIVREQFSPQL